MPSSISSPADMVNYSLRRIGYRLRVGNLFDGSEAGSAALDIYGQTRDATMAQNDYQFAERIAVLTLLKQAPAGGYIPPVVWSSTYPPLPWRFEYSFPDQCLKVKAVRRAPLFLFTPDPTQNLFVVLNDTAGVPPTPQRVIVANIENAIAVYTGRVTDPTQWDVNFTDAFAAVLAERLVPLLARAELLQAMKAEEMQATTTAEQHQR